MHNAQIYKDNDITIILRSHRLPFHSFHSILFFLLLPFIFEINFTYTRITITRIYKFSIIWYFRTDFLFSFQFFVFTYMFCSKILLFYYILWFLFFSLPYSSAGWYLCYFAAVSHLKLCHPIVLRSIPSHATTRSNGLMFLFLHFSFNGKKKKST